MQWVLDEFTSLTPRERASLGIEPLGFLVPHRRLAIEPKGVQVSCGQHSRMGDRLDHLVPNLAGLRVQFGWRAEVCASRKWLGIVDSARARFTAQQLQPSRLRCWPTLSHRQLRSIFVLNPNPKTCPRTHEVAARVNNVLVLQNKTPTQ